MLMKDTGNRVFNDDEDNDPEWEALLAQNSALDKNSLIIRVKDKIKKVSDHRRLVELKYHDLKWWYDIFNIFIIIISAVLTIIEAIKNDLDDIEGLDESKKQFFKLSPIVISTGIGLISSVIKFKRYQESLESIARSTEKGIFTMYRMKKLIEDLHFADDIEFKKKKQLYLDEIFNLYNQTQSELQKTRTFTDIIYYTNKLNHIELRGERNNILNTNTSKELQLLNKDLPNTLELQTPSSVPRSASPYIAPHSIINNINDHDEQYDPNRFHNFTCTTRV